MSGPLEPWLQDTAELPTVAVRRRLRLLTILGGCAVVMVALCLGGLWNINRLSNSSDKSVAAAAPPPVLPTLATTPDQTSTPDPYAIAPTTALPTKPQPPVQTVADKPKPTNSTSAPPPTTTAPPTTTPPGPPVPTGVRVGALCAPFGAVGVTANGVAVVCGPAPNGKNRWRRV